ncbi:MAG: hypothetical protein ACLUUO_08070 [Sellimonas intestinalis]
MQFLILVLLLLFEGIAIPKLQNDAAYFSLDPELIKGNTFRSHELTTDLIQAMRKSEEPARIAGVSSAGTAVSSRTGGCVWF